MNERVVRACAKINLGLEVLRKRTDGYHDIRSVFATIDLHDEIRLAPSDHIEVSCFPAMTSRPEENLAYRAAASLLAHPTAAGKGAKIIVTKHIPAGGGLGGGSSDAAAVLTGLRTLYSLDISDAELHTLGAALGSDVPFFLHGGIALVEGRGEIVTPIEIELSYAIVLVLPHIHVDTSAAYRGLISPQRVEPSNLIELIGNISTYGDHLVNDFEASVFAQHPVLLDIKLRLLQHGAVYASMSGSGSSIYGLFTEVDNPDTVRAMFPGMAVYICHFVSPAFSTPAP